MRLAMEIPTCMVEQISPLTDLDFCLAHEVLDSKDYAEFYSNQRTLGRDVILDNSFHELGKSMSIAELIEAAKRINPTWVIAPDRLGDVAFGYEQFKAMLPFMKEIPQTKLAVNMTGASEHDRSMFFLNTYEHVKMICFPYRENRLEWFATLSRQYSGYRWPPHIHLLGMNEFDELHKFQGLFEANGIPPWRVSIDTSKPLKWGLCDELMRADKSPRGASIKSADLLRFPSKDLTEKRLRCCLWNIAYLRKFLS